MRRLKRTFIKREFVIASLIYITRARVAITARNNEKRSFYLDELQSVYSMMALLKKWYAFLSLSLFFSRSSFLSSSFIFIFYFSREAIKKAKFLRYFYYGE